jgi:uncharacterized protein YoxC
MSPLAAWILVGLLAVLVGVAVPVLLQLRSTLATAEKTLESTGKRLDVALTELTETLGRVNKAAGELERGTQKLVPVFDAIHGLVEGFQKVKSSLFTVAAIGASIGPMMVAGMRGLLGKDGETEAPEEKR